MASAARPLRFNIWSHSRRAAALLHISCILILSAVSASACAGDTASSVGIDAYVASFLAAQEQAGNAIAYLPQPTFDGDDAITDAERASIAANYTATVQLSRDFYDLAAAITPPAAIQNEHSAFVAALDAQLDYRSGFNERYGQVQTLTELQELTAEVLDGLAGQGAQAALDSACHDLRDATDSAPSLITCGDEEP